MSARTRSIHRALIVRLLVAALLLAALLGGGAYLNERRQLRERIAERATLAVELLKAEMRTLLSRSNATAAPLPVQEALENLARNLPRSEIGSFVFVTLHDTARREQGRFTDLSVPAAPRIAAAFARDGLRFPDKGFRFGDELGIAKTPDVPVAMAIADARGKAVGYANGVFVLSEKATAELHHSALRAMGWVIAVILVTAMMIYPLIRGLTARLSELALQLLDANIDTIQVLGSAIAKRDSDTDAHNYRVTVYSVHLAEALDLDARSIRTLIKGAFLHDVGKIGIRDHILLKPGRLDEAEFETMQGHVPHGLDIVGRAAWLDDAAEVVGGHHEKYDGTGYPRALRGDAIPVTARIFAIADVFDALTSERPYKKPFSLDEALRLLRAGAGSHFDPDLVALFEGMARELHAAFASRDEATRRALGDIIRRYFQGDLGEILKESTV